MYDFAESYESACWSRSCCVRVVVKGFGVDVMGWPLGVRYRSVLSFSSSGRLKRTLISLAILFVFMSAESAV
jgi:hypothetical protein